MTTGRANGNEQTTAKAEYRGLSTARRTIRPSAASVEMTSGFSSSVRLVFFFGKSVSSSAVSFLLRHVSFLLRFVLFSSSARLVSSSAEVITALVGGWL